MEWNSGALTWNGGCYWRGDFGERMREGTRQEVEKK